LSTVAMLVMGVAGLAYRRRRERSALVVSRDDARRDLNFFLPVFLALVLAGTGHAGVTIRYGLAAALIAVYGWYAYRMLQLQRSAEAAVEHGLYLESLLRGKPHDPRIAFVFGQVGLGLVAIV